VLTALPVDRQHDVSSSIVNVCNNIDDERAGQLLTHAHSDTWSVPGCVEILGKLRKVRRYSL